MRAYSSVHVGPKNVRGSLPKSARNQVGSVVSRSPTTNVTKYLDSYVHFGVRSGCGESVTRDYCAVFESPDGSLAKGPPFAVPPLPDIKNG
jgi:hypothetical protein